ncbi:MAG TPA: acetamidase/formamidase family protein [Thermoanaerobaculia bacterium]|jgi:acetamidase/formamidase|nr:acetamidase/formamidase family protein [Thermoanaerobaculia bacterium]
MHFRSLAAQAAVCLLAAAGASAAAPGAGVAGEWELTTMVFGNPLAERVTFSVDGAKLTGTSSGRPLTGTVDGDRIRFETKDTDGTVNTYEGRVQDGKLSGTATITQEPWGQTPPLTWSASRPAAGKPPAPRTLDYEPKEFHRAFSADVAPALRIWPGDTVRTHTVDAAGVDAQGKTRVLGGNPQTGPFYVEGAMPGDVLVVHVKRLRLSGPRAISDDGIVERGLTAEYASSHKDDFNNVVWSLDAAGGVARPAKPTDRLKNLAVPLKPMLGCIGVAPGFGGAAIRTGDSGRIGGNMDFNEIVEGATVYLPVGVPGALLYVGDGHALQGDGELNGNALETPMDVEITVDLIREKGIGGGPRVENAEYLMAMGLAGSLDDAFREATSGLASWLEKDYGLTGPEAAILLGATVEYEISEVADRNAGVVAKIKKKYLPPPAPAK